MNYKENINVIPGFEREMLETKFNDIVSKNKDKSVTVHYYAMKIHNNPVMLSYFKYVPTTLANVQRSFSIYNNLLIDRRQNFTDVRLEYHLIIHLNSKK